MALLPPEPILPAVPSFAERALGENFDGRMVDQSNSKTEASKRLLEVALGAACPPGPCPDRSHQRGIASQ